MIIELSRNRQTEMLIARKIEAKHVNITNSNQKNSQITNQEPIQNIKFKAKKVFFINPENENQNNIISFKSFTKSKFLSIKPNKTQMPCTISKKKVKNLNLYSHTSRTKDKKKTNKLPCNYQENNITNKPNMYVQIREKEKGYYLK